MRKVLLPLMLLVFCSGFAFAVKYSYKNNTYQKLAEQYSIKAEKALDAGEYVLAEEYAEKAAENARLSEEFIKNKLRSESAEDLLLRAKSRLDYARSIHADENYPVAFGAALDYYNQAQNAYDKEDFDTAALLAQKVLDTLAGIKGMNPLPKFYIVQPWELTRDCLWNISGRTYVYNNPWLWENLYEANKSILPEPENPNLILPGMKLEIPSISGEYRSGTYDPDMTYGTYSPININK